MVMKTLTYLGNSPRPFGIRLATGYRNAFNPAQDKTLTLSANDADALLSAEPTLWTEAPPAPVTYAVATKEKPEGKEVKKVVDVDEQQITPSS